MNVQDITVDLSKKNVKPESIVLRQGDKSGTTLRVKVLDNGTDVSSLSGYAAKFVMKLPNDVFYYEVSGTIDGSTVTFEVDESQAAAEAGVTNIAYVTLVNGETTRMSANNVRVEILPSALEGLTPPPEWMSPLDEFFNESRAILRASINEYGAEVDALMEQAMQDVSEAVQNADSAADRAIAAAEAAEGAVIGLIPTASENVKGGIKVGEGLTVAEDEKMSVGPVVVTSEVIDGAARADGPIYSVEVEGWAEQASTTGKNLLPNNATSQTINGVTFTVNADGSVTANGTASATTVLTISAYTTFEQNCILSGCPSGGSPVSYALILNHSGNPYYDTGNGVSIPANTSLSYANYQIRIASDYTCNNITFYPQLEAGSTATSYEPYTGGQPSPSPDYPQEIKVARGRNLFTGVFKYHNSSAVIPVVEGETYTISSKHVAGQEAGIVAYMYRDNTFGGDQTFVGNTVTYNVKTITIPSNVVGLNFYAAVSNTNPNGYIYDTQLELGSTPTPYVPYGYVGLEVQGRNLFDSGAVTSNNYLGSNGSLNGNAYWVVSDYIDLHGASAITTTRQHGDSGPVSMCWYSASRGYISGEGIGSSGTRTFSIPSGASYVRTSVMINDLNTFQLELGSTATAYEPYYHETRAIPLPLKSDGERWAGGLPDGTSDVLTLDSAGRWEWENGVKEKTLDGSSLAGLSLSNDGTFFALNNSVDAANKPITSVISNRLVGGETIIVGKMWNSAMYVRFLPFEMPESSKLEALQSWLVTHPLTFFYPLATPTTEHGYIDLPEVPEGSTITIPELEGLGVRYFISGVRELAENSENWERRAKYEIEQATQGVESDLSTLNGSLTALQTKHNTDISKVFSTLFSQIFNTFESDAILSNSYSPGDYLFIRSVESSDPSAFRLYRVVSQIDSGELVSTLGSRIIQVTVMSELKRLTS